MLWLITTCTVGMSRPLEAEACQCHHPRGETKAGTHPRSLSREVGAAPILARVGPLVPLWGCHWASTGEGVPGATHREATSVAIRIL